jgi:hypothetical protein
LALVTVNPAVIRWSGGWRGGGANTTDIEDTQIEDTPIEGTQIEDGTQIEGFTSDPSSAHVFDL